MLSFTQEMKNFSKILFDIQAHFPKYSSFFQVKGFEEGRFITVSAIGSEDYMFHKLGADTLIRKVGSELFRNILNMFNLHYIREDPVSNIFYQVQKYLHKLPSLITIEEVDYINGVLNVLYKDTFSNKKEGVCIEGASPNPSEKVFFIENTYPLQVIGNNSVKLILQNISFIDIYENAENDSRFKYEVEKCLAELRETEYHLACV